MFFRILKILQDERRDKIKTKEIRINERDNQQMEINDKIIERIEEYVHLESIVN
jgi:hypothetical protein